MFLLEELGNLADRISNLDRTRLDIPRNSVLKGLRKPKLGNILQSKGHQQRHPIPNSLDESSPLTILGLDHLLCSSLSSPRTPCGVDASQSVRGSAAGPSNQPSFPSYKTASLHCGQLGSEGLLTHASIPPSGART